jgi:hypothetical protein
MVGAVAADLRTPPVREDDARALDMLPFLFPVIADRQRQYFSSGRKTLTLVASCRATLRADLFWRWAVCRSFLQRPVN